MVVVVGGGQWVNPCLEEVKKPFESVGGGFLKDIYIYVGFESYSLTLKHKKPMLISHRVT